MRATPSFALMSLLAAAPAIAGAYPVELRRDTVLPIVFEKDMMLRSVREGDRFAVKVDGTRDLPLGTRLLGRVGRVREPHDGRPGSVDLEFTSIELPNGDRTRIDALVVPLDDRYVRQERDGRIVIKQDSRKKEGTFLGGLAGGLVLGSLIKKPFEGAVIGAIGGIILAESDRSNDGNTIVTAGKKMGAVLNRSVTVDVREDDRWPRNDRDRDIDRDRDRDLDRDRESMRDRDIELVYGERTLRFDEDNAPYREDGIVMVPLQRAATQIGLDVDLGRSGTILVEDDDHLLKLERDSKNYRLDGKRGTLSRTVVEKNGTVYVPADILAEIKGKRVEENGNRLVIRS